MDKLLTVIVPAYNEGKNIDRCLDSLVCQSSKQINILVIDDGSNDNTKDVVSNYVNKYDNIKYIYKENNGISSARNLGLDNIDTPYFGFVDSDDYVECDMFEKMLAKITKDDSDICVCNFIWEYPNKSKSQKEGPYQDGRNMLVKMMATLWNKIYKTELIKKYDLSFPVGHRYEDSYFLICLASNDIKLSFVDEYFVHYVQHTGSITHTNNEKVRDMIEVFNLIEIYYKKHNKYEQFRDELEFLYAKYFLGSSFLRACQIKDKKTRDTILKEHVDTLINKYPNYKNNKYLNTFGKLKRIYYMIINDNNYKLIGKLINIAYKGL